MNILLVGYGWFAGIPQGETNNAQLVAEALNGETITVTDMAGNVQPRVFVKSLVVPVMWDKAFSLVADAIDALNPDIVLALGTAAGLEGLRPEPYGVNWSFGEDADPDDPNHHTKRDGYINAQGPAYVRGTLPYEEMVTAILGEGIPASIGTLNATGTKTMPYASSAGTYLCNYMAYMLPNYVNNNRLHIDAGFMHLPTQHAYIAKQRQKELESLNEEARRTAMGASLKAGMTIEMMVQGTRAALKACVKARAKSMIDRNPTNGGKHL